MVAHGREKANVSWGQAPWCPVAGSIALVGAVTNAGFPPVSNVARSLWGDATAPAPINKTGGGKRGNHGNNENQR